LETGLQHWTEILKEDRRAGKRNFGESSKHLIKDTLYRFKKVKKRKVIGWAKKRRSDNKEALIQFYRIANTSLSILRCEEHERMKQLR